MTSNKQPNGKGRWVLSDGDIYQGEIKNGTFEGLGVYYDVQEGSLYEGEFANHKFNGKGIETWNEGAYKYSGDFVDGQKTGNGKFEFEDSCYEGDFLEGDMHGHGKYFFGDTGRIYEGEFKHNNQIGSGTLT